MIPKGLWSFYRTIFGARLCRELEESKESQGPMGVGEESSTRLLEAIQRIESVCDRVQARERE